MEFTEHIYVWDSTLFEWKLEYSYPYLENSFAFSTKLFTSARKKSRNTEWYQQNCRDVEGLKGNENRLVLIIDIIPASATKRKEENVKG